MLDSTMPKNISSVVISVSQLFSKNCLKAMILPHPICKYVHDMYCNVSLSFAAVKITFLVSLKHILHYKIFSNYIKMIVT